MVSQIISTKANSTQPINSHSLTKSATFLKFFFRGTLSDRKRQNYISNEGSITQIAWNGMNKNSNWKVRLKTLENLEEVFFYILSKALLI